MKNILFCVSSDVVTDQRVLRHSSTLIKNGFQVTVIGRKTAKSLDIPEFPCRVKRFAMIFQSGPLFYFFFNVRLLLFLIFQPKSTIWSNDLDTLVPCYFIKKLKRQPLVFDAHELFTEVPELEQKALKKKIWLWVERVFVPKTDHRITVNHSLAEQFRLRYGLDFTVIRNVPKKQYLIKSLSKHELGIPQNSLVCILQGSGLNTGRGLLETVQAMHLLENIYLLVVGSGTALDEAKAHCKKFQLDQSVRFVPRLPYHEMMAYTQLADIGIAYDTHPCLNFQLALPNKIFDYFQAGIAVLCGPQPEIRALVISHDCGRFMEQVTPQSIAENLRYFQEHPYELARFKENSLLASLREHWENEELILKELLRKL